jgi:hypothetical protein
MKWAVEIVELLMSLLMSSAFPGKSVRKPRASNNNAPKCERIPALSPTTSYAAATGALRNVCLAA